MCKMDKKYNDWFWKGALLNTALLVEEDGLPCWCAQIVSGMNEHSPMCLQCRELTKGIDVRELSTVECAQDDASGASVVRVGFEPFTMDGCALVEYPDHIEMSSSAVVTLDEVALGVARVQAWKRKPVIYENNYANLRIIAEKMR
jgi:hypothetical protein